MVDNGHNLAAKDKLGATPIFYAAANNNISQFEAFSEIYKQFFRIYDKKDNTPLIMSIIARRCENIHFLLQLCPSAIKDKSILRLTPLSVACRNGCIATVRTLMSYKGSAPNQPGGWEKMTPLCFASAYGYLELAEFILTFTRCKIDKGDKFGRTPLMLACRNGNVKIALMLLECGANVKEQDTSGNTALHYAAAYDFPSCVNLLLDYKADSNAENLWKSTPISIAMLKRNILCVDQLLEKSENVNANIKDDNGNTLLSIAIETMNDENMKLVNRILENADPNIPDAEGNTPLMKVIYRIVQKRKQMKKGKQNKHLFKNEILITKKLIKMGADSSFKNKAGQNALTMIMENNTYSNKMSESKGISEIIELLWNNFSFFKDPKAFFSFNNNILSPDTQSMILTLIEKTMKDGKQYEESKSQNEDIEMEDEKDSDEEEKINTSNKTQLPFKIINVLDDDGYSPFLRYIDEFTKQGRSIYEKIERHVTSQNITRDDQLDGIDMANLLNKSKNNALNNNQALFGNNFNNNNQGLFGNNNNQGLFGNNNNNRGLFGNYNNNGGLFGNNNNNRGLFGNYNNNNQGLFGNANNNNNANNKHKELALKVFDEKIAQPFTRFLEQLVAFGADQHI